MIALTAQDDCLSDSPTNPKELCFAPDALANSALECREYFEHLRENCTDVEFDLASNTCSARCDSCG